MAAGAPHSGAKYEDFPELGEMHAYESLQLSAAALTHWYELDPEGARSAAFAEITRPKHRYNATVLGLLPDQTLPDVEHVIAEHLLAADNYEIEGNLAPLLYRYADGAVLPDVLTEFKKQGGKLGGRYTISIVSISPLPSAVHCLHF